MKITQTWQSTKDNTTNKASITITTIYQGTDEEMGEIIEWCRSNISSEKIMEVETDDE